MTALCELILERIRGLDHPLVTIDGPCASGKTTLAGELAETLGASVIHTDDFVIPHTRKTPEQLSLPGGNCDEERLLAEVLRPWKAGGPVRYRRYDFRNDRLREEEGISPDRRILILEGSYSNMPGIRKLADVRIFTDIPPEVREQRLQKRESAESLKRFHALWIPLENAYFEAFGLPDPECILWRGPSAGNPGKTEKPE